MFLSNKSAKKPILFDIRLNNADNGVVVLKGSPELAPSVFLSGTIVLAVLEPIQIKNIYLRLNGRLRLNLPSVLNIGSPPTKMIAYSKHVKRFYEHTWDNISIQNYFENLYDNYGKQAQISSKSSENISFTAKELKSNMSSLSLTSSTSNYRTLVKGNYEFPFSAILPGSITESVEGLPNASIIYKLHATIERGRSSTDLMCEKKLRIMRTLSADAIELSETVNVDNTWPNKVDYSISVPARAIAIGSSTKINIHIVPLLKGLRLGPIRIMLMENSQYCGGTSGVIHQERLVTKTKLKDPIGHLAIFQKKMRGEELDEPEEESEYQNAWDITTELEMPASLSKCTQDCNILKNIKVRHKIKFVISLINPDGHISELRASLVVQLYVSPFIPLGVKSDEEFLDTDHELVQELSKKDLKLKIVEPIYNDDDDTIFERGSSELDLVNASNPPKSLPDLMIPPQYEKHVFDRLWSSAGPNHVEMDQSEVTFNSEKSAEYLSFDAPDNIQKLTMNLEQLNMERAKAATSTTSTAAKDGTESINTKSTDGSTENMSTPPSISVTNITAKETVIHSPSTTPIFAHLSRKNSNVTQTVTSPGIKKDWEIQTLSRVPSYVDAVKNCAVVDVLPPIYPGDEAAMDQNLSIERPQLVRHRTSMSSQNSSNRVTGFRGLLSKSNNSSSSSLQNLTRSESVGSFTLPILSSPSLTKTNTASKQFAFGMTPYENNGHSTPSYIPVNHDNYSDDAIDADSKGRQRSNSLNSIIEMFTKR